MRRRELGDLPVSRIGLGTATWGASATAQDAREQLIAYVDAGGNLVDTADIYVNGASETLLGQLIGTVVSRSSIVLASKAAAVTGDGKPGRSDASRAHLLAALDASLARLGTDYLDLWQMHAWDDATPIEETLAAMDTALSSGRVRQAGICNYAGWQTALATTGSVRIVSAQVEYSLLERGIEREVVPATTTLGIGVLPWAPLGRGVLTGKYRAGVPERRQRNPMFRWYVGHHIKAERTADIVDEVAKAAAELGTSPAAVALAWIRDRPQVIAPLVGARNADQLREALAAEALELPDSVRTRLNEVSTPYVGYPERIM
jgi:aryl-alcohol dehydrogenase-like predicted oxidoreductase